MTFPVLSATAPTGYNLTKSLRLRSSASAYLSRTSGVAPTSRTTMTYSAWVKRGALGSGKSLFGTANNYESAYFQSDDTLYVCGPYMSGQQGNLTTSQVFRDPSAWYHIVIVYDTTNATATDRIRLYVNGSRVTAFSSSTNSNQNNTTTEWLVSGASSRLGVTAAVNYFDGYFAELNVIDGQALTPSSFGQTDGTSGAWVPKQYGGTYGNNGFYLPFTQNDTVAHLAYDFSQGSSTPALSATGYAGTYSSATYLIDGNITNVATSSWNSGNNYCGVYFPSTTRLQAVRFIGNGTQFSSDNAGNPNTYKLYAKNGAPSSATDGTLLQTITSTNGQTSVLFNSFTPGDYTYYWFNQSISATTLYCGEVQYSLTTTCNHWLDYNVSLTAGITYDSMTDVPTLTSATVANYCTLNPLDKYTSLVVSDGNLKLLNNGGGGAWWTTNSTIWISSGKWYWESTIGGSQYSVVGVSGPLQPTFTNDRWVGYTADSYGYYGANGNKVNSNSSTGYGASYTSGDVIGVALDMDAGTLTFYKNNATQGTAFTGLSGLKTPGFSVNDQGTDPFQNVNFGQQGFKYTPPNGYKALNTYNLSTPTIPAGNKYMDATLYNGTGSAKSVVNAAAFQPDFVWIKCRSGAYSNILFDSVRGVYKKLYSNTTDSEVTDTGSLTAFNSNGFSLGGDSGTNSNGNTFVGWQWKAGAGTTSSNTSGTLTSTVSVNASAGFSVVTYTGNGVAGATVGHGLGVAPKMIIIKNRGNVTNWPVYHVSAAASPQNGYMLLNTAGSFATSSASFNNTAPASSVFTVGNWSDVNQNGYNMVAYCWAEIAGYSKFGSYTGNGDNDGPFIFCGFKPRFILAKPTDSSNGWFIWDTARDTYNVASHTLSPNATDAETSAWYNNIDILANGFKVRSYGYMNGGGVSYIYAAFAENPFKYANAR